MTLKKALQTSTFLHALAFVLLFGGMPRGCSRGGGEGDSNEQSKEQAQHQQGLRAVRHLGPAQAAPAL